MAAFWHRPQASSPNLPLLNHLGLDFGPAVNFWSFFVLVFGQFIGIIRSTLVVPGGISVSSVPLVHFVSTLSPGKGKA